MLTNLNIRRFIVKKVSLNYVKYNFH